MVEEHKGDEPPAQTPPPVSLRAAIAAKKRRVSSVDEFGVRPSSHSLSHAHSHAHSHEHVGVDVDDDELISQARLGRNQHAAPILSMHPEKSAAGPFSYVN